MQKPMLVGPLNHYLLVRSPLNRSSCFCAASPFPVGKISDRRIRVIEWLRGQALLVSVPNRKTSVWPLTAAHSSQANLLASPPFPKEKPATTDHNDPSSRLHHWLPLSLVPMYGTKF